MKKKPLNKKLELFRETIVGGSLRRPFASCHVCGSFVLSTSCKCLGCFSPPPGRPEEGLTDSERSLGVVPVLVAQGAGGFEGS